MKDELLECLEKCREVVRASGGDMGKAFYSNHRSLGESISVEIDKPNSAKLLKVLNQFDFQYTVDTTGSFMDFYSIEVTTA